MASGRTALSNAKSGRIVGSTSRPDSRLAFGRQVRQTHRTHRTQGIIFADVEALQAPLDLLQTLLMLEPGPLSGATIGQQPQPQLGDVDELEEFEICLGEQDRRDFPP